MFIRIIEESGYVGAVTGLSLSYNIPFNQAEEVALKLKDKDGGHNKFLESIYLWLDVTAPRFWWQEADTYRLSTKQSESTMHTIHKRDLTHKDFEYPIPTLDALNITLRKYRDGVMNIEQFKNELPEGFLQRRVWVMNYKCLRNILLQRTTHRLPQWKFFCKCMREYVQHPELLPNE